MNHQSLPLRLSLFLIIILLGSYTVPCQTNLTYQVPPKGIVDIVEAPPTPSIVFNHGYDMLAILDRASLPSIEDLSNPELRIGGTRIDPVTNGRSRSRYYTGITIKKIDGSGESRLKGLPQKPKIGNFSWSPDDQHIAFTLITTGGIELWLSSAPDWQARKLTDYMLNQTMLYRFLWLPDSKEIIAGIVVPERGDPPVKSPVPEGPVIQETVGKMAAVRTYQDLLENRNDEEIFEYYTTSQLIRIGLEGEAVFIGEPGMYASVSVSPDGTYILVEQIKKPFSYLVPYNRFPQTVEIWDMQGNLVHQLANIPLTEDIPKGFDAVQTGPRYFSWRSDVPATVCWVEAQDDGDPQKEAEIRDKVFALEAPFSGAPGELMTTKLRFAGITWGNENFALVTEYWRKTRQVVTSSFDPAAGEMTKKIIFDRSMEDRYTDPGSFVTIDNEYGRNVLLFTDKGKSLYLSGRGASPEGNRPFLDKYTISTGGTTRLWRSEAPYYESFEEFIDEKKGIILTNRQSVAEPPNYFLRNLRNNKLTRITQMEHPYPQLKDVKKELVKYERKDGVQLTFELYLPAGYTPEDGPLPTLLWAYPREYKSAASASQVSGSPYTFTYVSSTSALLFVTQGYAILNNAAFPIVGEGDEEPNDTFIEQLVANAAAAIDKAVEMGVTDRERVAVGGHSYGAFMTANLLAHSDLFAAGIARSGAYNRTLTPFGFQAEPRTYWEAPDIYYNMSPFMHADQVKTPILLIHGIADNNSGTFPIQSERFYSALKGHGATARLVMLPHESHGYQARESVLHMLWESCQWLEKYVKNK
jgi:dipeptidyl aminopeptidase/acylaminoacyl peptidase